MRPVDWKNDESSIGMYSRGIHAFKHGKGKSEYEEDVMAWLDDNLGDFCE